MEPRKQNFDKCIQLDAKARNKDYVGRMTAKLLAYYQDAGKKVRQNTKHLCKTCFYIDTAHIGGAAITIVLCGNCGKEMSFCNTCTDILCDECAEELKCCKHCGQKMD